MRESQGARSHIVGSEFNTHPGDVRPHCRVGTPQCEQNVGPIRRRQHQRLWRRVAGVARTGQRINLAEQVRHILGGDQQLADVHVGIVVAAEEEFGS